MYKIQPTFFIYDYETFGLNTKSDRIAQFSGIRVDHSLCIIEKIQNLYCQIPNDYIPDPESVLVTGITPETTIFKGLTESEFAYRIFNIFSIPNTCIVGYNNIHFDDEFSRNLFYRNFCDPYSWSYQNGNSRWDMLLVLKTFYILQPEKIKWPINCNNQISFRLTDITSVNSIQHEHAHDAESDVYATLGLMKLLKTASPELFQFLYNHRTKNQLKKIVNIKQNNPLLYISNKVNKKNVINFLAPISWHSVNQNVLIAYNLNNKIDNLLNFDIHKIKHNLLYHQEKIFTILDKMSIQLVKINSCPILIPLHYFDKKKFIFNTIQNIFFNYNHYLQNLNCLKTNINYKFYLKINELCITLESYLNQKKLSDQTHVDNKLYYKFFNYQDQKIIKIIRNVDIKKLSTINFYGIDNRLKELLFFYRGRNFYHTFNNQEKQKWINYKKNIFLNSKKYFNYLQKIDTLLSYQSNSQKIKLLIDLKKYYQNFMKLY